MSSTFRVVVWAGMTAALALTFVAYLQPSMVVDLANRLWTCF